MAHDYGRDYRHDAYGHSAPYRGYEHRDAGNGAAAAVGLGILALGLFGALAAENNSHYDQHYYAPPPNRGYGSYGYYAPAYDDARAPYGYGR
jgi:hypothetical protein